MNRKLLPALVALLLIALASSATASLADYYAIKTTGSATDMSQASTIWQSTSRGSYGYYGQAGFSLGFNFVFDGSTYNFLSINAAGAAGLGHYVTYDHYNSFSYVSGPTLMPFWDQARIDYGGGETPTRISFIVTGTAPSRVLTVEWKNLNTQGRYVGNSCFRGAVTFQLRLYESTNKIEFYYGVMNPCSATNSDCYGSTSCMSTSASIGIARSASDWVSVTPSGSGIATVRYPSSYSVDLTRTGISEGTVYAFAPCTIALTGNTSQGGTSTMAQGDTLMSNITVQRGNTGSFQPININNNIGGCGSPRVWNVSISGPNASDYSVSPSTGTVSAGGTVAPVITFTPGAVGVRRAVLTVTDNNYYSRSFNLAAIGGERIVYIPNPDPAHGATPNLLSGDTLLSDVMIRRNFVGDLLPITLQNINPNTLAAPARITITIDSAGFPSTQYSLASPSVVDLYALQTYTPIIRFLGTGVGPQEGRLTITADGVTRVFILMAISGAPAIVTTINGMPVNAANPVFTTTIGCAGEGLTTVPLLVANTGRLPLVISSITFYKTDTVIRQGAGHELMRDAFGNPIVARDYVISLDPGIIPISEITPLPLPFVIPPGDSRTLYLTYVGQEAGKRFARLFMTTDAENVYGYTTDSVGRWGMVNFDLFGAAIGGRLAGDANGARPKTIQLPYTRISDTSYATYTFFNTGACELRINRSEFRFSAGDVNEFKLVSILPNSSVDAAGNYVIAPGASDVVSIQFNPSRAGTRMARIRLVTNDSGVVVPGITERGSYYLDVQGRGAAGLDGHDVTIGPVVIGTSGTGRAVFENTSASPVGIDRIEFVGGEFAEFSQDLSNPWPALPHFVPSGEKLSLSVRMTPVGSPGPRWTIMRLITVTMDTVTVNVRGEAGTQELVVSPSSLFDNVTVAVGQSVRRPVVITNNGTLPLRLTSVTISGTDEANYRLGAIPRFDLQPGAMEYVEVTFAPQAPGQSSAQLDVVSGATTYTVVLGGEALRIRQTDPTAAALGSLAPGRLEPMPDAIAGADGFSGGQGVLLLQSRPNPAATSAEVAFVLGSRLPVRIDLFDARGGLVKTLTDEPWPAGRHALTVDVRDLPEGTYRYTLVAGGVRLSQPIVIVR